MSKLDLKLSYKNACILKHALRDKVIDKKDHIELSEMRNQAYSDSMSDEEYIKELEEEERALKAITEEIESCGFMHNTKALR